MLNVGAAGLLLPSARYYSDSGFADIRRAYVDYIAGMLRLVNWDQPERRAKEVLALETRLAAVSWTVAQRRTTAGQINPMTVAELRKFAPDFDWQSFLRGAGLSSATNVVVDTKDAFPKLASVFKDTPIEVWQARQAFAILDQDGPKLDDKASRLAFNFRSTQFQGAGASQPPDFRIMLAADASIPDIVGELYAKRYFTPEMRVAVEDMARRIRKAFDARLASSPYLSDASKQRARAKLAAMEVDVGAPKTTRDYRGLVFSDTDYFGNLRRARDYEWKREIETLDKPFDRTVWPLQPHNANYAYIPAANIAEASAGALMPPFFDITADPAVNYGGAGTMIAAQMAAAFDENGREIGPEGGMMQLFTPDETARLDAARDSLAAQLSAFEPLPGMHLNGGVLAREILDDIVGLQVALDAYHESLSGKPAPVLDGLTGDQRFFLGRGQMWRAVFAPPFLRTLIANAWNTYPPIRIAVTSQHIDAWYDAFNVHAGQKMYIEPARRLHFLF
jgi:putative endopeptidase